MVENSEIWARFLEGNTTLGPTAGVREAWHRGRERYALWLIRMADPEIAARMDLVHSRIRECSSAVPADQRHITLFVCGFPRVGQPVPAHALPAASPGEHPAGALVNDDVDAVHLEEQVAALRAQPPAGFEIAIGGVSAFLTAPFLHVADDSGGITRLRERLGEPLARRGGREVRFAPYVPHLTVAHFTAAAPTHTIARALEPLRELEPLSYRVTQIELVDFCARTAHAPFRVLAEVGLASTRAGEPACRPGD